MPMKQTCTCEICGEVIKSKPSERHKKTLYVVHGRCTESHEDCCLYFCNKCWKRVEICELRAQGKALRKRCDIEWRKNDLAVIRRVRQLRKYSNA